MKLHPVMLFFCCWPLTARPQDAYLDSIKAFQKNYVDTHEVVLGPDRQYLSFYPADQLFCVEATFEKAQDTTEYTMSTSSGKVKRYLKYGLVRFRIHDTAQQLTVYQSIDLMKQEKYRDYLFIPFGDATSGFTSYGGGRYLDFVMGDIRRGHLLIDFNKAYNPYCAYTTGYNCPIPPVENILTVAIDAGEKNYGKPYH